MPPFRGEDLLGVAGRVPAPAPAERCERQLPPPVGRTEEGLYGAADDVGHRGFTSSGLTREQGRQIVRQAHRGTPHTCILAYVTPEQHVDEAVARMRHQVLVARDPPLIVVR